MKKRSVILNGHATSVSLEDAYWDELRRMALASRMPVAKLIAAIDGGRGADNLSSAIRLAVLADLKARLPADRFSEP